MYLVHIYEIFFFQILKFVIGFETFIFFFSGKIFRMESVFYSNVEEKAFWELLPLSLLVGTNSLDSHSSIDDGKRKKVFFHYFRLEQKIEKLES